MATTTSKATTTTRRTSARKAGVPAATPPAPAAPAPGPGRLDLAALGANAKRVTEPVRPARGGRGGGSGPALTEVVKASFEAKEWREMPPVPADKVVTVRNALRRAAAGLEIGVSIVVSDPDEAGNVTVSFKGKAKGGAKK